MQKRTKINCSRIGNQGIEGLAVSIVIQAIVDYERSAIYIKRHHLEASDKLNIEIARKRECERFLRGDWFSVLCNLDGKKILERLEDEIGERYG